MGKVRLGLTGALVAAFFAAQLQASVISFTGGTVNRLSLPTPVTTNNIVTWDNVDNYEEDGFILDFVPNSGSAGFATHVGNYYGAGNDVIHSHWLGGGFGSVTAVEITAVGGVPFDLNYFILTSNTVNGGGAANGTERAWVEGFNTGGTISTGPAVLLPSENWGFPATPVFLGPAFDAVDLVRFFVTTPVACFGMDEFFINEPAPGTVPEASSILAWTLLGTLGTIAARRRGRKA